MCSKKVANTLLYLASICEKNRDRDASESRGDIVPEFSLKDFEDTDFTLTGVCADVLKDKFASKKTTGDDEVGMSKGVHDWTLKGLEDPQGHFKTVINLYKLVKVPVMVLNMLDAAGNLIHPSEYSKHFTKLMPVAAEVVMCLWTFAPDNKRPTGSHIYQTTLRSLWLLPQFEPEIEVQTKTGSVHLDPKGKRKVDGPADGGSPAKKSTGGDVMFQHTAPCCSAIVDSTSYYAKGKPKATENIEELQPHKKAQASEVSDEEEVKEDSEEEDADKEKDDQSMQITDD
ncbi:hypothetical protein EDD22DRAFT_843733 [Suillus occidentalis]|nr:hypothetical protein EDD22DRAFT_843733 [Suillus occidentalis]